MKKFLVLLLALALVLACAACGPAEEPAVEQPAAEDPAAAEPAAAAMPVSVVTADGAIEVDVAAQELVEKSFQATSSTGEAKDLTVTGFDLLAYLEGQGVDLSGVEAYSLEANDGYTSEVAAADISDGLWLCTVSKGEALDAPMSAVPGGMTGAMVKGLVVVTLNYAAAEAEAPAAGEAGQYVEVTAPAEAITMNDGDDFFVKCFVGGEKMSKTLDEVLALPTYNVTLSKTNKEGVADTKTYTGVKWDDFVASVGLTAADVTSVTFVCSDGYEADVADLALLNAEGSILAYLADGEMMNEGAGYLWFCTNEGVGQNWCKYVEKIIINDAE